MATHQQQAPDTGHDQAHPGVKEYVIIAVVLAVLTLIEVGALYVVGLPDGVLITALLLLAVLKFALVLLWFMHLKFESRLFLRLFVTGLILTLSLFAIVLATFAGRN